MNRLLLIDGNAILHRAFHAIPHLTAPDGLPVNAVYGFATMLFRFAQTLEPTHIAVAFDRPAPTFRKKLFAGYQIKRPKMDESLVSQIDRVHELVTSFGIPIFEYDGFEADDLIGTLSKKPQDIDQVIIVTGDRDILQLVEDNRVLVFMPTKGISEGKIYAEKDVIERMGIAPSQIPDLKGLMGDSSDNYPGVEGIGPKTALKLLAKYTTLAKLLESDELSDEQKESARLSFELATIRRDVPIKTILVPIPTLDTPQSRAFLERMRFFSLLKKLDSVKKVDSEEKRTPNKQEKKENAQQALF